MIPTMTPHQTMMMETATTMIKKRHEYKYKLASNEALILKSVLDPLLDYDPHAKDGYYEVRSLYYESPYDKNLLDKLGGISKREKLRIRFYDHDLSYINFEKKVKEGGLGHKTKLKLDPIEVKKLLKNDCAFLKEKGKSGLEFYAKIKSEVLNPKTIITYRRLAYHYPLGNVRITIDDGIRTSLMVNSFLEKDIGYLPLESNLAILEIKYDSFLPDFIKRVLKGQNIQNISFSKYAYGRYFDYGGPL